MSQTRKKIFRRLMCHPRNKTSNSCLDHDSLTIIKNTWNKRHPDEPINSNSDKCIWENIKKKMENSCNTEMCWVDKTISNPIIKSKLKKKLFAPTTPKSWRKNKYEWLSSVDISKVLKQYETMHKNFSFIGPSPIDFDDKDTYNTKELCVWPELCKFKIENYLKKNINNIGFVFNTDKHFQEGSHWFSMYLNTDIPKLFFFDSAGNLPPKRINKLIKKIKKQFDKINKHLIVDMNHNKHQTHNTECGMYSLYFIINLLEKKKDMDYFKYNIISDNLVRNLRSIYFNIL